MAVAAKVNGLAVRKRLLVAESELNRQAIAKDLRVVAGKAATLARWALLGWKACPVLRLGMKLARAFSAKRRARSTGVVSTLLSALRFGRYVLGLIHR
jgi:hypothetical protein